MTQREADVRDGAAASLDRRLISREREPQALHVPGPYERFAKPVIDVVGGLVLILLAAPLMALIAVAILVTDGRPAIFKQERVGRNSKIFTMYKFRTMHPDRRVAQPPYAPPDRRRCHKTPDDPRLTRLGHFLRKWSLDELPQLWNVVLRDMSLVGPRPELLMIVERYEPWQHLRHQVKPGITGVWQVSERGDGLMHENIQVDLLYLERVSLLTDLRILLRTIPAALGNRTGY